MNSLESLRRHTTVVADTGQFMEIAQFAPRDATTNPSLILKAVKDAAYAPLLDETVGQNKGRRVDDIAERLLVRFGLELLKLVPGRVSTEVDARLSFDARATADRGRRVIALYEEAGISRDRILVKMASTWEGIQAARELQAEGVKTNLTLLFSMPQAIACALAGVQLVSPFVGRILDWHRQQPNSLWRDAQPDGAVDPGVQFVSDVYGYFRRHGFKTEVMGASFRTTAQVIALAGCDLLTISPGLLAELRAGEAPVRRALLPEHPATSFEQRKEINEATFRSLLNQDAMATEKLAEGIRGFVADTDALDHLIQARL